MMGSSSDCAEFDRPSDGSAREPALAIKPMNKLVTLIVSLSCPFCLQTFSG